MGEYVKSSKGVGCLGCQPSGFGLFGRPTIGSMGTDSWLDWASGEEPQSVNVVRTLAPGFANLARSLKRVGDTPSGQTDYYPYPGSEAPPQDSGTTVQQTSETAALRQSQANVNLEEGGAPNWVGPVIMGVIGLGMVGGVIWGLKKLDVI